MSTPFYIIDGYNLLHAAGLARARYGPGDLKRQRHRLLVRLTSEMLPEERIRCTVVFDAIEAPTGLERRFWHGEIHVMFAEPGHEADELIEALIASHASARQLLVVSSDHRLQKAAKQRRADSLDSEAFLERLKARAKIAAAVSPGANMSDSGRKRQVDDVRYWMEEFGKIDVDAIEKQIEPASDGASADPWQQNLDELQQRLNGAENLDDWLNRPPDRR